MTPEKLTQRLITTVGSLRAVGAGPLAEEVMRQDLDTMGYPDHPKSYAELAEQQVELAMEVRQAATFLDEVADAIAAGADTRRDRFDS